MPSQEINVPDMPRAADDPRWDLPAVAFMRNGTVISLAPRTLRQAQAAIRRAGDADDDVYIRSPLVLADDLRNLGVELPDR